MKDQVFVRILLDGNSKLLACGDIKIIIIERLIIAVSVIIIVNDIGYFTGLSYIDVKTIEH